MWNYSLVPLQSLLTHEYFLTPSLSWDSISAMLLLWETECACQICSHASSDGTVFLQKGSDCFCLGWHLLTRVCALSTFFSSAWVTFIAWVLEQVMCDHLSSRDSVALPSFAFSNGVLTMHGRPLGCMVGMRSLPTRLRSWVLISMSVPWFLHRIWKEDMDFIVLDDAFSSIFCYILVIAKWNQAINLQGLNGKFSIFVLFGVVLLHGEMTFMMITLDMLVYITRVHKNLHFNLATSLS